MTIPGPPATLPDLTESLQSVAGPGPPPSFAARDAAPRSRAGALLVVQTGVGHLGVWCRADLKLGVSWHGRSGRWGVCAFVDSDVQATRRRLRRLCEQPRCLLGWPGPGSFARCTLLVRTNLRAPKPRFLPESSCSAVQPVAKRTRSTKWSTRSSLAKGARSLGHPTPPSRHHHPVEADAQ